MKIRRISAAAAFVAVGAVVLAACSNAPGTTTPTATGTGGATAGTATGGRYIAETNGGINTFGKATTFLPGTLAGTNPTGGIYA